MKNLEKRFFADAMVGRLARWLRVLGMDVEYERDIDDDILIKRAISGDRIILTRDTLIVRRRLLKGRFFFIKNDHIEDQLREVLGRFGFEEKKFFSRCLLCNLPLDVLAKEAARGRVPVYVFKTQSSFSTCRGCGRIYWQGTQRHEMEKVIRRVCRGQR